MVVEVEGCTHHHDHPNRATDSDVGVWVSLGSRVLGHHRRVDAQTDATAAALQMSEEDRPKSEEGGQTASILVRIA